MGLQVWLPLNGNLNNQGLSKVTIINNGATIDNNGKIGKCYYFNGSSYIKISMPDNMTTLYNTSICAWIKSSSTTVALGGISNDVNYTVPMCTLYTSGWQFGNAAQNGYRYLSGGTIANTNIWHHVACTISDNLITTYLDGIKVTSGEVTGPVNFTNSNFIEIGCDHPGGDEYLTGYVNDFRIYDHCLSNKEVEELAKGLVLHYKLDDIGQDYSTNLVTSLTAGGQTTVTNNVITTSGTNADTYFTINLSENIVEGTSYIISCDAEIPEGKCWTFPLGWQGNTSLSFQIYNGHNVYVFTANSGNWGTKRIFMDDGGSPNSAKSAGVQTKIFNFCVTKSGNISDSSGYNNYGELYGYDSTGSIILLSDSPRYNVSTFINSVNNTTNTASGTRYIYGHCTLTNPTTMSVAFWCKPIVGYGSSTGQGQFCTTTYEFGNTNVGSDYQASAMNHRDNAVDINDSASATQCRPTFLPTANEWHHYVITYDGQNGKVYKDGVQNSTASFSAAKTLDSFIGVVIGFSKAGGVWRSNQSYFSDFRLYVTALTPEQILELYNTSATIDNQGNIYARELVES